MTFGGRTGGNASQAPVAEAVPKQHGNRRSGPRTTTHNGPGRSTCPGSAAGATEVT